jgi:hypothetical protein
MYEINILENDEFDALPYKHAKTALGMADAATGKAYIRRTGIEALDANTIRHEFDELLQKISPHEEDGIRYKSGGGLGSIFAPILGGLAYLINPALGVAVGAALKAGTSAYSSSVKPEKYGENTFGSVLGNAAVGGLGAYGAGNLASGALSGFKAAGEAGKGFFGKLGGALKGATGIGASGAAPSPSFGSQTLASGATGSAAGTPLAAMSLAGGGVGTTAGTAIPGLSSISTPLSGITPSAFNAAATGAISQGAQKAGLAGSLAKFGKSAASGAAKNLAGSTLLNSLAPPQATAVAGTGDVSAGNAGNYPGGNSGVLGIFGNKPAKSSDEGFKRPFSEEDFQQGISRINATSTRQTGSVFDQFRASQPGATIQGSSAFAKQLGAVEQGNQQNISQFTTDTNAANQAAYRQYQYDGVKNANGLNDSQMSEYISLARQPDEIIRRQFPGMTPQAFRDIFAGLA